MFLYFLFLTFFFAFNVQSQSLRSLGCGQASPFIRSTRQESSIISNGLNRTFNIYLPDSYSIDIPVPLVFVFHGGGGTGNFSISNFFKPAVIYVTYCVILFSNMRKSVRKKQ